MFQKYGSTFYKSKCDRSILYIHNCREFVIFGKQHIFCPKYVTHVHKVKPALWYFEEIVCLQVCWLCWEIYNKIYQIMILSPPIYVTSSNINSKTCSNICTLSKTNITRFCLHWSGNKLKPGQHIKTWGYMRGLFNVYLYLT